VPDMFCSRASTCPADHSRTHLPRRLLAKSIPAGPQRQYPSQAAPHKPTDRMSEGVAGTRNNRPCGAEYQQGAQDARPVQGHLQHL
jgi:hypothetical protein